jgi:hypothetical protein
MEKTLAALAALAFSPAILFLVIRAATP